MAQRKHRVVVAMSGGVDSSVAAALLVEAGFDVIGISMRLADEGSAAHSSGCCSLEDFRDAGRVADILGVPHYVFDMRSEFASAVVRPFIDDYLSGKTPSPCILCNRTMKFGLLRQKAVELGASHVATGHYARRDRADRRYRLLRGRDVAKDQSYFLFEMSQQELAVTLLPIGEMTKPEVRRYAEKVGLPVAQKADSQEICFVPDGRYTDFVQRTAGDRVRPGEIRDEMGNVLGTHAGVQCFTIGQRRGLGVSAGRALYVASIDAASAAVTIAPRDRLEANGLEADAVTWVSGKPEPLAARVGVKIRYRHGPVGGRLYPDLGGTRVRVMFDDPQEAVAPGQAVVFYRNDEVLGGGWIRTAMSAAREAACA